LRRPPDAGGIPAAPRLQEQDRGRPREALPRQARRGGKAPHELPVPRAGRPPRRRPRAGPIGGETCVDYSRGLKKELAGRAAVWVAGYSNDVMGYIPSRRVREEGGYEATEAMRSSRTHPAPWAPTLEEKIIGKVHELDRGLSR